MRKRQKRYSPEFKRQAVEQAKVTGRPVKELAAELGVPMPTLWNWLVKAEGRRPMTTLVETPEEELKRLRKENDQLRMERDFLKKATAFFAKESK